MRILIVSPHFPPTNAADMQRVRLILPYLRDCGVAAEVLAVCADDVASPMDAWLEDGLPEDVPIHRVRALGLGWSKMPGLGTLTFRALGAIRRKGNELLGGEGEVQRAERRAEDEGQSERLLRLPLGASRLALNALPLALRPSRLVPKARFDLVYFSTTQFGIHGLGPEWKRKFGVPFVMDYQDPWVSDYYREHPEVRPPGGRLKYGIASWLSRRQEPRVLRHCSGITSVSAAYPVALQARYPWLGVRGQGAVVSGQWSVVSDQRSEIGDRRLEIEDQRSEIGDQRSVPLDTSLPSPISYPTSDIRHPITSSQSLPSLVLPFPGDARDFERVKAEGGRQTVFDPNDGLRHWVYIGVVPPSMRLAVRAFFAALVAWKTANGDQAPEMERLRLHFIGTSYAAAGAGRKMVEPLAREYGLEKVVHEMTDRIPYSETLRCLLDADALIIPGTDDPGYTASKIYPYLLAGKPLLAVFHEQSSVVELIRQVGGGTVIPFATGEDPSVIGARISREWLAGGAAEVAVPLDPVAFAPYTARAQAEMLAEFWGKCKRVAL